MSDWSVCEFCGEQTFNEGRIHQRCLEPYIQKLKRQADHFRHLATDTVAAQPGQYEILGPLSEEVRTYTSIPVEELEELKAKGMRPEVKWFADKMEQKLKANDLKGGWTQDTAELLFMKLTIECMELGEELAEDEDERVDPHIVDECVDVANFAMMIADLYREEALETEDIDT